MTEAMMTLLMLILIDIGLIYEMVEKDNGTVAKGYGLVALNIIGMILVISKMVF